MRVTILCPQPFRLPKRLVFGRPVSQPGCSASRLQLAKFSTEVCCFWVALPVGVSLPDCRAFGSTKHEVTEGRALLQGQKVTTFTALQAHAAQPVQQHTSKQEEETLDDLLRDDTVSRQCA